jgi:methyltransferase (TIGR00027 family)
MASYSPRGLAGTAHYTAAVRARESERTDALFSDPWAALLAGEEGFAWEERLGPRSAIWPIVRTRFFDDLLCERPLKQIVLPAAGLDTRAYRLAWPVGTRLFELDQPDVMDYKERILTQAQAIPQCQRVPLSVDLLRQPWADLLIEAGFEPAQPSTWIVEGLLMYLDQAAQQIIQTITRLSAVGSWLGLDLPQNSLRGHRVEDPQQWLAALGWAAQVAPLADVAAQHGRWPYQRPAPAARTGKGRVFLIAAQRQQG